MPRSAAGTLSPEFHAALAAQPDTTFSAILRYEEAPEDVDAQLAAAGLTLTRRLRLIRGLAVEGTGQNLLKLAAAAWVTRIEADQPIHTMR
ncbi:MAG: hypothetical protein HUU23_09070 [Caldilineales bacterium]|nr:hypothetical protein [Caldilineales bacterium]